MGRRGFIYSSHQCIETKADNSGGYTTTKKSQCLMCPKCVYFFLWLLLSVLSAADTLSHSELRHVPLTTSHSLLLYTVYDPIVWILNTIHVLLMESDCLVSSWSHYVQQQQHEVDCVTEPEHLVASAWIKKVLTLNSCTCAVTSFEKSKVNSPVMVILHFTWKPNI